MDPISWLETHVAGFRELSIEERGAITNFSLLWSLFEGGALRTNASARGILVLTHEWAARDVLRPEIFARALEYLRLRYFPDGQESEHFRHLHLRGNDSPALVRSVLNRENQDPADTVAAILIVIYRFRNNLFHGRKWDYQLRGQLGNFEMANDTLMLALERNEV
jgi:hypothetical protein